MFKLISIDPGKSKCGLVLAELSEKKVDKAIILKSELLEDYVRNLNTVENISKIVVGAGKSFTAVSDKTVVNVSTSGIGTSPLDKAAVYLTGGSTSVITITSPSNKIAKEISSPPSAKSQLQCASVPITPTPPEPSGLISEPEDTGDPAWKAIKVPPAKSKSDGAGKATDILLSVTGGVNEKSSADCA